MKIGYVEFGAIQTEQHHVPAPIGGSSAESLSTSAESLSSFEAADPASGTLTPAALELTYARETFYDESRSIMLVHRLFRSTKPGQVYDILIYLVPRGIATLVQVTGVEYFFGRYWGIKYLVI